MESKTKEAGSATDHVARKLGDWPVVDLVLVEDYQTEGARRGWSPPVLRLHMDIPIDANVADKIRRYLHGADSTRSQEIFDAVVKVAGVHAGSRGEKALKAALGL